MGYLEKVFIGSLLLFALVILFMFGLYFDVGSMLQSAMQRTTDASSAGSYTRAADTLERSAVKTEVQPSSASRILAPPPRMDTSTANSNFEAIYARYSTVKPPPTLEERMDMKRKRLAATGYGQEYIEMEVRAMDVRAVDDVSSKVDAMMAKGQYDEAEKLLLEQLESVDARDLMTLQRYRMKLQQCYFDSNQFEKYKDAMKSLFDTEDKILAIQASSKMMEDKQNAQAIKLRQRDLAKQRGDFEDYYTQMTTAARENGGTLKLSESQKSEIKAGLLREQEAGRITPQDLQDALSQLEQQAGKKGH